MVVRHHDAGQTVFSLIGIKPGRVYANVSSTIRATKNSFPLEFRYGSTANRWAVRQYDAPAENLKPDPDQLNYQNFRIV